MGSRDLDELLEEGRVALIERRRRRGGERLEARGERNSENVLKVFCLWFSGLKGIFRERDVLRLTLTVIRPGGEEGSM